MPQPVRRQQASQPPVEDKQGDRGSLPAGPGCTIPKDIGLMWLNAARAGDLPSLQALLPANPDLLFYRGQGCKYELVGHTALHW